jgi:hypothetical protein
MRKNPVFRAICRLLLVVTLAVSVQLTAVALWNYTNAPATIDDEWYGTSDKVLKMSDLAFTNADWTFNIFTTYVFAAILVWAALCVLILLVLLGNWILCGTWDWDLFKRFISAPDDEGYDYEYDTCTLANCRCSCHVRERYDAEMQKWVDDPSNEQIVKELIYPN